MAITVKNTVVAPINIFKYRKLGEYTLTINPFNKPASPIRKIGMTKRYILKLVGVLRCVSKVFIKVIEKIIPTIPNDKFKTLNINFKSLSKILL